MPVCVSVSYHCLDFLLADPLSQSSSICCSDVRPSHMIVNQFVARLIATFFPPRYYRLALLVRHFVGVLDTFSSAVFPKSFLLGCLFRLRINYLKLKSNSLVPGTSDLDFPKSLFTLGFPRSAIKFLKLRSNVLRRTYFLPGYLYFF